jgi:ABC-type sugar transport system ATPase subunit
LNDQTPTYATLSNKSISTTPYALEVINLHKHFGGVIALDGVSLWARHGEVTAIIGDNGAGKSTLIKCITGVITPDEGSITLDGQPVNFSRPEEAREMGIETVYQDLSLINDLSVYQNFFLGREKTRSFGPIHWLDRKHMRNMTAEALAELAINVPSPTARVRRLSGGQRQAIAVARAANWGKSLVIMDEPTASLGVQEMARVEKVITNLKDKGLPILLISHDMEQVIRLSQQIWILRGGRLAGGERTAEVSGERLVALITGAATLK